MIRTFTFISVIALVASFFMSACTSTVPADADDTSLPDVRLQQIATPRSRVVARSGTPGNGNLQETVTGRDRLVLHGHGSDSDGGLRSVVVKGSISSRCESILGASNVSFPLSGREDQSAGSSGQVAPFLNTVLDLQLAELTQRLEDRCEPMAALAEDEWKSGRFTANATKFSGTEVRTFEYRFLWRRCPGEANPPGDWVTTERDTSRLRIHSNGQWTSVSLGGLDNPGPPAWSPCKDRVVFRAQESGGDHSQLLHIYTRGAGVATLVSRSRCTQLQEELDIPGTARCELSDPDWSRAGDITATLNFLQGPDLTPTDRFLVTVDPDTGEITPRRQNHNGQSIGPAGADWSPYGDRVIMRGASTAASVVLEGIFISIPGFRNTCKVEMGNPEAWIADGAAGSNTLVAYKGSDGIHIVTLAPPATRTGCPTIVSDVLMPGSRAGDMLPGRSIGSGFAFIRRNGNSLDLFRQSQGSVTHELNLDRDTTGFDF